MNGAAYLRMAARTIETNGPNEVDSEATESDSNASAARKGGISAGGDQDDLPSGSKTKPAAAATAAATPRQRQRQRQTAATGGSQVKRKKRRPSGWRSDTLSSDSSEDVQTQGPVRAGQRQDLKGHGQRRGKRARAGSPSLSGSSLSPSAKNEPILNGLKKLPKGYVYDTDINQAAFIHLSANLSQTGEYMQQLRGKRAQENDFPDMRGKFGLDLSQHPSFFAMEQQTGYTYPRLRNSGRERLPKAECEDGYAMTDLKHNGTFLGRLFCITDGHGGKACSSFVVATIPGAMQVILGKYRPSDLSLPSVQELVKSQITEAVRLIDKEYLDYKKQQYLLFKSKKIPEDPGSDGTTLIVNIFIDKWIINVNLGDSRTMLGQRDPSGRWCVDFFSEDHTPSLERLAQTIYTNGGEFVTHDDKIIRFDPNMKNDKKHRQSLREARIRVKDGESNTYGIPYRAMNGQCASVNLGACIGDVLYKLDPQHPILGCKPDVTFLDVSEFQQGFLLMASDGLWDYVQRGGRIHDQNATVCQFLGDKLDRGWNHQRIVCTLSDRESINGLYSDSIHEYDDFTAILVTFNNSQLKQQQEKIQQLERQQLLVQKQRIQEQQLRQRQREVEELQRIQQQQIRKEEEQEEESRRQLEQQQAPLSHQSPIRQTESTKKPEPATLVLPLDTEPTAACISTSLAPP